MSNKKQINKYFNQKKKKNWKEFSTIKFRKVCYRFIELKFIKNNFYLKIINKIDSKIIEIKLVLFFKLKDKKQKKLGYKK